MGRPGLDGRTRATHPTAALAGRACRAPLITWGQRDEAGNPLGGDAMRIILNVIWLVLCGIWMSIAYALAGLLCFVLFFLVITIPFGIAAFRIANYVLWPFGRTIAPREGGMGIGSIIGNIIWVILFGWELALGHLIAGILLCITIIGIPLGLASFKIIPVSLVPLGVRIVPADEPSLSYT